MRAFVNTLRTFVSRRIGSVGILTLILKPPPSAVPFGGEYKKVVSA